MYQLYYTDLIFVVNLVLAKTTGQLKKAHWLPLVLDYLRQILNPLRLMPLKNYLWGGHMHFGVLTGIWKLPVSSCTGIVIAKDKEPKSKSSLRSIEHKKKWNQESNYN